MFVELWFESGSGECLVCAFACCQDFACCFIFHRFGMCEVGITIAQDKDVFVAAAGWKCKTACLVGANLSGCLESCCIAVVGFLGNFVGVGEGIFTWVGGV